MMQQKGEIDEKIMYNTFNMGIGMVVAVAEEDVRAAMAAMKAAGDTRISSVPSRQEKRE